MNDQPTSQVYVPEPKKDEKSKHPLWMTQPYRKNESHASWMKHIGNTRNINTW